MAAPLNELLCMRHLALHSCPTYCRVLPRPLLLRCSRPNTSSAMADAEPPARTIQLPNTMEAYKAGPDQRVFAPAAARNKAPILETLSQFLVSRYPFVTPFCFLDFDGPARAALVEIACVADI